MKYLAFLSYRSSDRTLASWLHRKLEAYRVPKRLVGKPGRYGPVPKRLSPIFRDRDDARSASDIETTIKDYLAHSRDLIVLCTPSSAKSESWVGREIELFRLERPGAPIHSIIGSGEPPDCFPRALVRQASDGSVQVPLAADLRSPRQGGDGRKRALIKLVASVAGVEFDDLWRRELRRQRLRTLIVGLAIVMLAMVGVIWFAQREDARLTALLDAAQTLDPRTQGDFVDLLTLAGSPPAKAVLAAPSERQIGQVESIARRGRSAFAGAVATRHQGLGAQVIAQSADGRLVFSRGASEDDGAVFVWDATSNRLLAKLPTRSAYWRPRLTERRIDDASTPVALDVAADGRVVAALYEPESGRRWTLAVWKLSESGICDNACVPETFDIDLLKPPGSLRFFGLMDNLRLSSDGASALFGLPGSTPYAIDLLKGKANALAELAEGDIARCVLAVPALDVPKTKTPKPGEMAIPPPFMPDHDRESYWFSDTGERMARLRFDEQIMRFYSRSSGRELARLKLPPGNICINDCNVAVVFLDDGRRALIANIEDDAVPGRVFGIVSLDECAFDTWPPVGPGSLLKKGTRIPGGPWAVHRVTSHVVSRSNDYAAAAMTLSSRSGYMDIGVIFGLKQRRPLSLFFPKDVEPEASDIKSLQVSEGESRFLVLTDRGSMAAQTDGGLGVFQPIDVPEEEVLYRGQRVPVWRSEAKYSYEPMRWFLLGNRAPASSSVLDFYGDRIGGAAVSTKSNRLALAQSGVVYIQPAAPGLIRDALALKTKGVSYRGLAFSPDGETLGAAWRSSMKDEDAVSVSVWNAQTGALVAERELKPRDRLLAVTNNGKVIINRDGDALALDLGTGESSSISSVGWSPALWKGSGLVLDNGAGQLLAIDALMHAAVLANLPKGQVLQALAPDGKTVYISSDTADYFGSLNSDERLQFLSATRTGASAFSRAGKLAIVVKRSETAIEIWDPVGPVRTRLFEGPWEDVLLVWFSQNDSELWAMDSRGLLYRWVLDQKYPAILRPLAQR